MSEKRTLRNPFVFNIRGNLIAGLLAVAPLIAVWLIFDFLLDVLFRAGRPLAEPLDALVEERLPRLAPVLDSPVAHWLSAIAVALVVLYVIGAVTSRVIGMRLMGLIEGVIARVPLVETVYSAVKKLVGVARVRPDGAARVVLVEFPHPGARAVGLVMRTIRDAATGEDLVAVLVPTSPNPSTGYLQIVPASRLFATDMTIDQAMTMIISGGGSGPESMRIGSP